MVATGSGIHVSRSIWNCDSGPGISNVPDSLRLPPGRKHSITHDALCRRNWYVNRNHSLLVPCRGTSENTPVKVRISVKLPTC